MRSLMKSSKQNLLLECSAELHLEQPRNSTTLKTTLKESKELTSLYLGLP